MKLILTAILLLTVPLAYAQQQLASIEAESTGTCSPNILSNQGKVEFTCKTVMDNATATKIVSLLNQVLKHQDNSISINQKLDQILEFLQTHTQNAYDRVVWYSFDGMQKKVVSKGGTETNAIVGGSSAEAFKEMQNLQTERNWSALLAVCQKAIAEERGWATPYLFSSFAHANLGNLDAAAEELRKAKSIVHDSPEYADAINKVSLYLEQTQQKR